MSSVNKTEFLELNQWQGNESPKRQDFVDDNKKVADWAGEVNAEVQNARGIYANLKARLDAGDSHLSDMENDRIYYCGTTSGTNTYTVANSEITAYTDGLTVRVKIGTASTGASTLNINGLGAKTILDTLGNAITSGGLKAELPYQLCYNGTNFIVLGKGGGGNLTGDKLLTGYSGTGDNGVVNGTMVNRAGDTACLSSSVSGTTLKLRASDGYRDGVDDNVTITDADFIVGNIKSGINVLGLLGTYDPLTLIAGTNTILVNDTISVYRSTASPLGQMKTATNKNYGGIVTVTFTFYPDTDGYMAQAQIYVNGVARGTSRTNNTSTLATYSENIAINAGDTIQLYGANHIYVSLFKISCGNVLPSFV